MLEQQGVSHRGRNHHALAGVKTGPGGEHGSDRTEHEHRQCSSGDGFISHGGAQEVEEGGTEQKGNREVHHHRVEVLKMRRSREQPLQHAPTLPIRQ